MLVCHSMICLAMMLASSSSPGRSRRGKYPAVTLHAPPSSSVPTTTEELLLAAGLAPAELDAMARAFPGLLSLDASKHVAPKLRFLERTMGASARDVVTFPHYFGGPPLEKALAPRHAFLVERGLPTWTMSA